jgi:hypothetical protein
MIQVKRNSHGRRAAGTAALAALLMVSACSNAPRRSATAEGPAYKIGSVGARMSAAGGQRPWRADPVAEPDGGRHARRTARPEACERPARPGSECICGGCHGASGGDAGLDRGQHWGVRPLKRAAERLSDGFPLTARDAPNRCGGDGRIRCGLRFGLAGAGDDYAGVRPLAAHRADCRRRAHLGVARGHCGGLRCGSRPRLGASPKAVLARGGGALHCAHARKRSGAATPRGRSPLRAAAAPGDHPGRIRRALG